MSSEESAAPRRARPLQLVKIDLATNSVVIGKEELLELQDALKRTGVQKLAVVGVIGAFRTGKSFLLDLMLRYLRNDSPALEEREDCVIPEWVLKRGVPPWAVQCGDSLIEGRQGSGNEELNGFLWRPGMEKCTEGIWVWSEAFVRRAGDEEVALLLMDTQGAWDAQMTKEQSATVFGLTTLITSRLVYNVSKQIQQDKIDNLLYFTDFAQAALRSRGTTSVSPAGGKAATPFQTLEFLVRDWPHYPEGTSVPVGRDMMLSHLEQYMSKAEETSSMGTLQGMFENIDTWCLPHPSLNIERQSWDGDLAVIEPSFWRFLDGYLDKVFSPAELAVKTTLGTPLTVDMFSTVLTEFITAFENAAPQAQTFAEAMETSTALLARDSAMKLLKSTMQEEFASSDGGLPPDDFELVAAAAAGKAEAEFKSKALFGTQEGILQVANALKVEMEEALARYREENERRLEASLSGLTNISLGAVAGFVVDRASDVTCDWWSDFCQDLSNNLALGYWAVALYVLYSVNNVRIGQGQLGAVVAMMELGKSMVKRVKGLSPAG